MSFAQARVTDQNNWLGFADILPASQVQDPLFVELRDGTEIEISQFFEDRKTGGLDPLPLTVKMTLAEEVTFINKGAIIKELNKLEDNSYLIMDVSKTHYLDNDIVEILDDFKVKAEEKNINIKIISERGIIENPESYQQFFNKPKTA